MNFIITSREARARASVAVSLVFVYLVYWFFLFVPIPAWPPALADSGSGRLLLERMWEMMLIVGLFSGLVIQHGRLVDFKRQPTGVRAWFCAAAIGVACGILTELIWYLWSQAGPWLMSTVGGTFESRPDSGAVLWGVIENKEAGLLLAAVLLGSSAEELFFRWAVLLSLVYVLQRPLLAAIVSGALFGLIHVSLGVPSVIALTIAGGSFAIVVVKTRAIELACFAHIMMNVVIIIVALAREREGAGV